MYPLLLAAQCIRNERPEILFYLRYALVALLFALLVTQLLKASCGMPRPDYSLPRDPFSFTNAYSSFPSGHTVSIIIAAMPLAFRIGKTRALIAAPPVIALFGYSRVWLGVHHPADILARLIVRSTRVWDVFTFPPPSGAAAPTT